MLMLSWMRRWRVVLSDEVRVAEGRLSQTVSTETHCLRQLALWYTGQS